MAIIFSLNSTIHPFLNARTTIVLLLNTLYGIEFRWPWWQQQSDAVCQVLQTWSSPDLLGPFYHRRRTRTSWTHSSQEQQVNFLLYLSLDVWSCENLISYHISFSLENSQIYSRPSFTLSSICVNLRLNKFENRKLNALWYLQLRLARGGAIAEYNNGYVLFCGGRYLQCSNFYANWLQQRGNFD